MGVCLLPLFKVFFHDSSVQFKRGVNKPQASLIHFGSEMRTLFDCCNHLEFSGLSFRTALLHHFSKVQIDVGILPNATLSFPMFYRESGERFFIYPLLTIPANVV